MTSVWIVSGAEYDDHGPVAAFTTRELAEAYAAPKGLTVDEFTVHDRLPTLVTLHFYAVAVLPDGTVQRAGGHSQEFWDSEAPDSIQVFRSPDRIRVVAWQPDRASAERACFQEVQAVLGGIHDELQHPAGWLYDAIENARQAIFPPSYVAPREVCYEAPFGRVHVRPGCRCAR